MMIKSIYYIYNIINLYKNQIIYEIYLARSAKYIE